MKRSIRQRQRKIYEGSDSFIDTFADSHDYIYISKSGNNYMIASVHVGYLDEYTYSGYNNNYCSGSSYYYWAVSGFRNK